MTPASTTTKHTHAERSPSGLFRMSSWEGEMERSHPQLPRWYWNEAERRKQYARWVEAEAESLALRLAGRPRPADPQTARPRPRHGGPDGAESQPPRTPPPPP
ncbi:hypothetical protein GAY29_19040, partial [Azospirillum brasilense]|nr:hypothetical protein [Azospirillum brasilense]